MLNYYQAPTTWATRGILYTLLLSIPLTLLLGYVYTTLMVTLPFVWLLPILVFIIVLAWSWGVRLLARWFQLYNKKSQLFVALLSSLVLFYGQWLVFVLYLDFGHLPSLGYYFGNFGDLFKIENTASVLTLLYNEGFWEVGGAPLNGMVLVLFWIIEALLLLLCPALFVWKVPLIPYSEQRGKWYDKYVLERKFGTLLLEQFPAALQQDPITTIEGAPLGKAGRYRLLELYHLPKSQKNYAAIVLINLDHKGNQEKSVAVPPFLVERTLVERLITHYEISKERLELF
ncbi:MAG: hypothetical protein ACRBFS_04060 [Aureispira sp.]